MKILHYQTVLPETTMQLLMKVTGAEDHKGALDIATHFTIKNMKKEN